MERKIPKNIRQIGNVSDNPKIYVEDYVDTFLNQLCDKGLEEPIGVFLIGESHREDEQDYLFVSGAIEMEDITIKNNEVVVGDKSWKKGLEECKKFFNGKTIVGWTMMVPNMQLKLDSNLVRIHEKLFQKKTRILILKDPVDKEEVYHVYKYNDLMEVGGHFVYYEKNQNMQEYMIAKRKQNCVTPSEVIEDRVTKDFRSIIQEKENKEEKKKSGKFLPLVAAVLLLFIVIMGVSSLNDPSKIESLQASISDFMGLDKEEDKVFVDDDKTVLNDDSTQVNNIIPDNDQENESINTEDNDTNSEEVGNEQLEQGQLNQDETDTTTVEDDENQLTQNDGDDAIENELVNSNAGKVHIVAAGDTIAAISRKYYGSMSKVQDICELNSLESGDYIIVGQEIKLP